MPAGGSVLLAGGGRHAPVFQQRGDLVTLLPEVRLPLPHPGGNFLVAAGLDLLPDLPREGHAALVAELCRVAARYVALSWRHVLPPALHAGRPPAAHTHRSLERLLGTAGFRPLSRSTRLAFLDPIWFS
ncbi:MAG: hypothetical protein ACE5H3_06580, partial [Planctomycetota bacterium]